MDWKDAVSTRGVLQTAGLVLLVTVAFAAIFLSLDFRSASDRERGGEVPEDVTDLDESTDAAVPIVDPDEAASTGAPVSATGPSYRLVIPVAGIRPEELVDTYTDPRGSGRYHRAIDIMAPTGTPVLAATDGTVLRKFVSDAGGITLYKADRAGEYIYYYAHLDRYAPGIEEDMTIRRGQTIGYVGHTGNAEPGAPHLHFAIWRQRDDEDFWTGDTVNPYPLLTRP
jgi:peptidoglycan LD-endopeptidase LytH